MNLPIDQSPKDAGGEEKLEEDVSVHIFTTSAAMVGVCLTVITVFQIGRLSELGSIADNILAIDALAFLIACLLSYIALRTRTFNRRHKLERCADVLFMLALALMAIICILVAFAFV